VSYFRLSALGRTAVFGGGNGALNADMLDDDDNDFVNAAANDGLAPDATEPRMAAFGNLDRD